MPHDAAARACAATLDMPFDVDWAGAMALVSLAKEMLTAFPSIIRPLLELIRCSA